MGAVLLHCRDPLRIVEQCGKRAKIAHHRRQVPSGPGRRAGMSLGADTGEFYLAHVVAFQHAVLHTISRSHGVHDDRNFNASAISPRKRCTRCLPSSGEGNDAVGFALAGRPKPFTEMAPIAQSFAKWGGIPCITGFSIAATLGQQTPMICRLTRG